MTVRLHLGGSRHGKLIDIQSAYRDRVEYRNVERIEWSPGQHTAPQQSYSREVYEARRIGFFGRTLQVMFLEGSTEWDRDNWAFEFLVGSLTKSLIKTGGVE